MLTAPEQNCQLTNTARKAPRTAPAPAPKRHALLGDALHTGVLAFLTLRDTAVTLNCCCATTRNWRSWRCWRLDPRPSTAAICSGAAAVTGSPPVTELSILARAATVTQRLLGCLSNAAKASTLQRQVRLVREDRCGGAYANANRECLESLYTQMIRNELVEGGFSAQEIEEELRQLDRHTEFDLQGDDLLQHVLHQDLVDLPRVVCVNGLDRAELAKALSEDSEFRVQCPKVYQPPKQFLLRHCSFTNRIFFHRIPKKIPAIWEISGFRYSKAELVGGVSRSGFFIGVVVITY